MPKRKTTDRKRSDKGHTQYHQRASGRSAMVNAPTYDAYKKQEARLNLILGKITK